MHFLNIDEDFALGFLGQVAFELLDFSAFAPDDDTGARSTDGDAQFVAGTIHFNGTNTGGLQTFGQRCLQLNIFMQQLGIVLLGEPARAPGFGNA